MDIEKIKVMYNFSKEIEEKRKAFYGQIKTNEEEITNKAIDKINNFFNTILDSIDEDYIYFKFKNSKEDVVLRKEGDIKYALFPHYYNQVLVCSNYTGEIDFGPYKGKPINKKYTSISNYYEKERFVDYFLKNKEEIEQVIYDEITKSIDKKIKETANKIQNKAAYLERVNNYVEK